MAFLEEIAGRLVSQGVGTLGTNIFSTSAAQIPPTGGPYLVIVATPGSGSALTQNNTATTRPSAQISVRAVTYAQANAKAVAAYNALGGANGLWNVTLSGTMYLRILARQEPGDIGLDGAGRPMVAFNIEVEKQPS